MERARSEHSEQVAALIARGVRFAACRDTMRQKLTRPEEYLIPDVATVPSGAVGVVREPRDGSSDFKPRTDADAPRGVRREARP